MVIQSGGVKIIFSAGITIIFLPTGRVLVPRLSPATAGGIAEQLGLTYVRADRKIPSNDNVEIGPQASQFQTGFISPATEAK